MFFRFLYLYGHFWALGVLWGRRVTECSCRDTLPRGLLPRVQLGKFADFWVCCVVFNSKVATTTTTATDRVVGVAAGLPYASSDLRAFLHYP